jgi:hypothetical protein
MPAFPGAEKIFVTRSLFAKEQQIACSRPPDPITKMFIKIELARQLTAFLA